MARGKSRLAHLYGINFMQLTFGILTFFVIAFFQVGGIYSLIYTGFGGRVQIPLSFAFFDWIPAVYLFVTGLGISLQFRNKYTNRKKLISNITRKGALFLAISLLFVVQWGMNLFFILGLCMLMLPLFLKFNSVVLHGIIIGIILASLVMVNLDVPYYLRFHALDIHKTDTEDFFAFLFFNGYYSFFPWFSFILAGFAFGKGAVRPRGFFPPTSILAIVFLVLAFLCQEYCETIYLSSYRMSKQDLPFPSNFFVFQPSFVFMAIGISWLLVNFINHLFTYWQSLAISLVVKKLSSMKFSLLFFGYFVATFYLQLFTANQTYVLAFVSPFWLIFFIISLVLIGYWLCNLWLKKVNKYTPLEWLIKSISVSSREGS
jgi:hypothetical protein